LNLDHQVVLPISDYMASARVLCCDSRRARRSGSRLTIIIS